MMKYSRKQNVVARSVAGMDLLVPVHECTRCVYTLNPAGRTLWDLIASPHTENELAEALADRYHIPFEDALRDVCAFLSEMVQMELVTEET